MSSAIAQRQLANALKQCHKEPIEGFCVELLDDDDLFAWKIYLEGPSDSPYEGGIFQAVMKFPPEFPMLPPSLRFLSDFWHPNVYPDGTVCISILHAPGEDAMSGELPEERWLPTQTVGTILLSVISMLNDPNTSSPANVDAGVMWRNERDTYIKKCKDLVSKANAEMPEGIEIPHPDTNPEEKQKQLEKMRLANETVDFFDDSDGEDFFPASGDDQNSVNSAFYDTDDGSVVGEAEIWKNEEIMEESTEVTEVAETKESSDVLLPSGNDEATKEEDKKELEEAEIAVPEKSMKETKQEVEESPVDEIAPNSEESPSNPPAEEAKDQKPVKGSGKKKKECAIM